MIIRNYKNSDYETICSLFKEVKEIAPQKEQLPEESSFVAEVNGKVSALVTIFLTNVNICYMENLIANPKIENRKEIVQNLMNYVFDYAKNKGYKYAAGFTMHEKLAKRHIDIGWDYKVHNVIIVGKEL